MPPMAEGRLCSSPFVGRENASCIVFIVTCPGCHSGVTPVRFDDATQVANKTGNDTKASRSALRHVRDSPKTKKRLFWRNQCCSVEANAHEADLETVINFLADARGALFVVVLLTVKFTEFQG